MRWSFFFLAEYASMFVVSMAASVLFLGAWHTGLWFDDYLLRPLRENPTNSFDAARYLANVFGLLVITIKGTVLIFVQMWLRWTLPRLRIDQVMTTCLKYLVPISCFLFLGAAVWPLALAYFHGGDTTWVPKRPLGDSVPGPVSTAAVESARPQVAPSTLSAPARAGELTFTASPVARGARP